MPQHSHACALLVWPEIRRLWAEALASDVPPLRWSQTETTLGLELSLRGMSLHQSPILEGGRLILECSGAAPRQSARNYSIVLTLLRTPEPLRSSDFRLSTGQMRITFRKRLPRVRINVAQSTDDDSDCGIERLNFGLNRSEEDSLHGVVAAFESSEELAATATETADCEDTQDDASWPRLLRRKSLDQATYSVHSSMHV